SCPLAILRASMERCLDEGTVVGFVEGTLAAADLERVEQHMASCARCRVWISELADATYPRGTDRYERGELIGRGGMGEVRGARCSRTSSRPVTPSSSHIGAA